VIVARVIEGRGGLGLADQAGLGFGIVQALLCKKLESDGAAELRAL
jgi:hypothetical protein